jgi:hypothetical protein
MAGVLAWERMMVRVSQEAGDTGGAKFRNGFTVIVLSAMSLLILGLWFGVWATWLGVAVLAVGIITVTILGIRRSFAKRKMSRRNRIY